MGADPANVGASRGRPDILPGCNPNGFGAPTEPPGIVWDRSCFTVPQNGTYGTATRGALKQPRFPEFNLNVFKVFPLTRYENGPYLKVEWYITNPFNHTNPTGPISLTITNPSFGQYRASDHVRRMFFRFRIGF